jgi:hypothetical protein
VPQNTVSKLLPYFRGCGNTPKGTRNSLPEGQGFSRAENELKHRALLQAAENSPKGTRNSLPEGQGFSRAENDAAPDALQTAEKRGFPRKVRALAWTFKGSDNYGLLGPEVRFLLFIAA